MKKEIHAFLPFDAKIISVLEDYLLIEGEYGDITSEEEARRKEVIKKAESGEFICRIRRIEFKKCLLKIKRYKYLECIQMMFEKVYELRDDPEFDEDCHCGFSIKEYRLVGLQSFREQKLPIFEVELHKECRDLLYGLALHTWK